MLTSTGALQSPAPYFGHKSRSTAHHPWALPCQQTRRQPTKVAASPAGGPQPGRSPPQHSCVSVTASNGASQTSSSASVICSEQADLLHSHASSLLSWNAQHHQQQQQQWPKQQYAASNGSSPAATSDNAQLHYRHAQQQQHTVLQASAATFSAANLSAEAAAAAATPATASWSVLQLKHHDHLSAEILSCTDAQQLLVLSNTVAATGSKHHAAQLTVMASLLVCTAGTTAAAVQPADSDAVVTPSSCHLEASGSDPTSAAAATARQLTLQVVQVLTQASAQNPKPPLAVLHSKHLLETLLALQQLLSCTLSSEQQQEVQLKLRTVGEQLGRPEKLADVHACTNTQQLAAVVDWLQDSMGIVHIKAALVQLARMHGDTVSRSSSASSSSSTSAAARDLADQLLQLLLGKQQQYLQQQQQQYQQPQPFQIQPHYAASILWSVGQLRALGLKHLSEQLAQQLLHASLSGVEQLNPRVAVMLLQGAAKLQLQLPEQQQEVQPVQRQQQQQPQGADLVRRLLHHTQQQLCYCDPQSISGLLWGLAQLQQQPSHSWLQQFYSISWRMLSLPDQPASSSSSGRCNKGTNKQHSRSGGSNSSTSSSSGSSSSSSRRDGSGQGAIAAAGNDDDSRAASRQSRASAFYAQELAAVLSALVYLELQPPAAWLTAAAVSCHKQLQHFNQQELALTLWAFAQLQHRLPDEFLAAASRSVQLQLQQFSAQNVTLLLYAVVRLDMQPRDRLVSLMWQRLLQLQQAQQWPETLDDAVQQLQDGTLECAAAAAAASAGRGEEDSSSSKHSSSLLQLIAGASEQAGQLQLQQHNAQDLALLAWSLGQHCKQQQQLQSLLLPTDPWLQAYLAAATQQLQYGGFTSQGMSMMLWGLGTALHTAQKQSGSSSSSRGQLAAAAAFWPALEIQSAQQLGVFSGHELANLLWGAGRFFRGTNQPPSSEWVDLLACQCLDMLDQLSGFQLGAALQGLVWLQHPRGVNLLQAALSDRGGSRMRHAWPQEVLLMLRSCVHYGHTPEHNSRAVLLAAVRQRSVQMAPQQLCQAVYLLGKMQQQYGVRQRQAAAAAAAAATGAAGLSPRSSVDAAMHGGSSSGSSSVQQQQYLQGVRISGTHSSSTTTTTTTRSDNLYNAQRQQQQQQQHQVEHAGQQQQQQQQQQQPAYAVPLQQQQLVPAGMLCQLVQCMTGKLHNCSPTGITLMAWGLSRLATVGMPAQISYSSSSASNRTGSSLSSTDHCSSNGSEGGQARAAASTEAFADCPAGRQLLQELYDYSSKHLQCFKPSELATLLYSVHKLGVVRPPADWLNAITLQLQGQFVTLDGQSFAAVALALAGFNWEASSSSWLSRFVEAAVAAEKAGKFLTGWQRAGFSNGLSALDPVAGQCWLQRMSLGGRVATAGIAESVNGRALSSGAKQLLQQQQQQQQAASALQ